MRAAIERLRARVVEASSRPGFRHHAWYVRYHLEIVERIAAELLDRHPEADRDLVETLVWLHDYGKTVDPAREYELTLTEGRRLLADAGFPATFAERVIAYAGLIDRAAEVDLTTAPIEVRIVSSADGCAHFVGPFFPLWWREHADRPIEELMAENRRKMTKDWTRKIVLPEARAAFATRYAVLCEQAGAFPAAFLADPPPPSPGNGSGEGRL